MQFPPRKQRGYLMIVGMVIAILVSTAVLVAGLGTVLDAVTKRLSGTHSAASRIQDGLVRFAGTYKRLPCPADPTGANNAGWPNGNTDIAIAVETCTYSTGVVPWRALGLSQSDVMDEWGSLISYRVFDGTFGLTQTDGASALLCDTNNVDTPETAPSAHGLCNADTNTLSTSFFSHDTYTGTPLTGSKGLNVEDSGTTINQVAYVLISHGPTGRGAYLPSGSQKALPETTASDYPNTRASPTTFRKAAQSSPDVAEGSAGHFDDVVVYQTLTDLLRYANLAARDWAEVSQPSFTDSTLSSLTQESTSEVSPHFMTTGADGSNQEFTKVDASGSTGLQFGLGTGGYSGCLWWPSKQTLKSGTKRYGYNIYMEFASVDASSDAFTGFTMGFLSGSDAQGKPTNSTCGTTYFTRTATGSLGSNWINVSDASSIEGGMLVTGTGIQNNTTVSSISGNWIQLNRTLTSSISSANLNFANQNEIRRDLGWAGGTLAAYTNRFAIELDTHQSSTASSPSSTSANDPSRPHLAIDYTGVTHGSSAESCTTYNYGAGCQRPTLTTFSAPSPATRTATGVSGTSLIEVSDVTGILHGMTVTGIGIGSGATVTALSGKNVTLSVANSATVNGSVTFSTVSSSNFLQNGVTVFHSLRAEVSPMACARLSATGATGGSTLTVSSASGLTTGMGVYGAGIAPGATITAISGTTLTVSLVHTANVSGDLSFAVPPTTVQSASGTSGVASVTVPDIRGIGLGMTVSGGGVGSGAKVTSIVGTTIGLSVANTADFTSTSLTFTTLGNSRTASATLGSSSLTVSEGTGITAGMSVVGDGIPTGTTVSSISGTSVSLSAATTAAVAGSVKFLMAQTLIKSWVLSNAGCNESSSTCTALKDTTKAFQEYLSTNSQALHAVSCLATPTPSDAFDSFYWGLTSANRSTSSSNAANLVFRQLSTTYVAQ